MTSVMLRLQGDAIVGPLSAQARARGCRPQQLACALVMLALAGDLVDAVLDGADPAKVAPHAGKTGAPPGAMTPRKRQVLDAVQARADAAGAAALSITDLAETLTIARGNVRAVLMRLVRDGLLLRLSTGVAGRPATYALTEAGHAALDADDGAGVPRRSRSGTSQTRTPEQKE